MTELTDAFDPWGPVSSVLYSVNDSDLVADVIAASGLHIVWGGRSPGDLYSHKTRIRAMRRDIDAAYAALDPRARGFLAQSVVLSLMAHTAAEQLRRQLNERLSGLGWAVDNNGRLDTEDALLGERFFAANSEYDAYIAIRELLAGAAAEIMIVDPYLGPRLLQTLRAVPQRPLTIRLLTVERHLRPDFRAEVAALRTQERDLSLDIRDADDFHDRFIDVDGTALFHVGASLKDAGRRAFMISRLEDPANVSSTRSAIEAAWSRARPLIV